MSRQRDAELDRLKSARESAYQRKQAAWERRSSARAAMNRAYESKQAAYADQQAAWEAYMSVKRANGPRIDSLNAQQEQSWRNMKSAFESASLAHDMRDGASARMYADQGHAYKEESQTCAAERRQLVAEIRAARERLDAVKPAFQTAKDEFARARRDTPPLGVRNRDNDTNDRSGVFYDRNRRVDLHVTQYYGDNYRISWDTDGESDKDHHWTNQSLPYGHPDRHNPPEDAR